MCSSGDGAAKSPSSCRRRGSRASWRRRGASPARRPGSPELERVAHSVRTKATTLSTTSRRAAADGPGGPRTPPGRPPRCAVLGEEQRGDQEAGEDEEEVDAQVAARQAAGVEREHADDGEAAQAVERGDVAQAAARGTGSGPVGSEIGTGGAGCHGRGTNPIALAPLDRAREPSQRRGAQRTRGAPAPGIGPARATTAAGGGPATGSGTRGRPMVETGRVGTDEDGRLRHPHRAGCRRTAAPSTAAPGGGGRPRRIGPAARLANRAR